jgi:ubiquinone/menaquinone biosynthesis C-methylase UbiE
VVKWRELVPTMVKRIYWLSMTPWYRMKFGVTNPKNAAAFHFWLKKWEKEGKSLNKGHYKRNMLAMAEEKDQSFLKGRIVADFGCGPRGSLCWATEAKARIGIDVLVKAYERLGISEHNMDYVCSTETEIPLPSNYVDVLFTLNALDHVDNFPAICKEILRVLAPGGILIASLNLDEEASVTEPQVLTEDLIDLHLLQHLKVKSYRIRPKGKDANPYEYFFTEATFSQKGSRILWLRASKD